MATKQSNAKTDEHHKGISIFLKRSTAKKNWSHVSLFNVLADRSRYRAIALLLRAKGGVSVSEIAESLDASHSSASHLLAVLHDAGIVSYRKRGREVRYEIAKNPTAKRVVRLMRTL